MNTLRTRQIKRYDKSRHPKNSELPDRSVYDPGVKDEKILLHLGNLIGSWPHLEEAIIGIFGALAGLQTGSPTREIFRSFISNEAKADMMQHLLEETEPNREKPPFFDVVLDEFRSLNRSRNKYVHGLWFTGKDGSTYLSTSDPAGHPFETNTRKIRPGELKAILTRVDRLKGTIIWFETWQHSVSNFPEPLQERYAQLLQGKF